MNTPIYLRDLNESLREQLEHEIENGDNKDLKIALENGNDITIGHFLKAYKAD